MSDPRRLDFRGVEPDDRTLTPVAAHVRAGGLLAYPTETVYGFGGRVAEAPLERLAALKGRDARGPFLLLVPHARSVAALAWTEEARELASVFWPGALTLVLADPGAVFPERVRSERGGVAVRQCAHPLARRLVELLDEPLTSTSANAPGAAPARDADAAYAAALEVGAGEEMWVIDSGPLPGSAASTIVDCTGGVPRLLRAGATPLARLRCVLPHIESSEPEPDEPGAR